MRKKHLKKRRKAQSLAQEPSEERASEGKDDASSSLVFVGVYPRKSPDKVAIPHTRYPY